MYGNILKQQVGKQLNGQTNTPHYHLYIEGTRLKLKQHSRLIYISSGVELKLRQSHPKYLQVSATRLWTVEPVGPDSIVNMLTKLHILCCVLVSGQTHT